MSWREIAGNAQRLLLWRMRINRMQFCVGYIALCFFGAVVMQIVFFAIAVSIGSIEVMFDHLEWTTPGFLLLGIVAWALIANRAHDIGWPGWPFLLLYLIPIAPWLIVMDGVVGILGGAASHIALSVPIELLYALIFVPGLLINVSLVTLVAVRGQSTANRFGEPPLPGLWGDLSRSS